MMAGSRLTVEAFYQRRDEWPEGGRWCELIEGEVFELSPPDVMHSGVVLNLASKLGVYAQETQNGYAMFRYRICCRSMSRYDANDQYCLFYSGISIWSLRCWIQRTATCVGGGISFFAGSAGDNVTASGRFFEWWSTFGLGIRYGRSLCGNKPKRCGAAKMQCGRYFGRR